MDEIDDREILIVIDGIKVTRKAAIQRLMECLGAPEEPLFAQDGRPRYIRRQGNPEHQVPEGFASYVSNLAAWIDSRSAEGDAAARLEDYAIRRRIYFREFRNMPYKRLAGILESRDAKAGRMLGTGV
ncbi:MAG: hypothetical protein HYW26_04935 [Candidatus Aenigmarchaeota archaeon]|nr:hypothetical protein [Candidatus Aenigmarchaeota archaeon]